MKDIVTRTVNKVLAVILAIAILCNGALAVYQTKVYVRLSFGNNPDIVEHVMYTNVVPSSALQPPVPEAILMPDDLKKSKPTRH